jgi:hypothetical protein
VQIEPGLRSRSPKNGNISNIRRRLSGDFSLEVAKFGVWKTDRKFAKARHWRAFLALLWAKSPGAGLAGAGGIEPPNGGIKIGRRSL